MSMCSNVPSMETLCAEVYCRTIIQCEEAQTLQQCCLQFGRVLPLSHNIAGNAAIGGKRSAVDVVGQNNVSIGSGRIVIDVGNSCGACCNRREIISGVCKHASEAAESALRFSEFQEYHRSLEDRIRTASARIRNAHLSAMVPSRGPTDAQDWDDDER